MMQRAGIYDPELSPKFQKARFDDTESYERPIIKFPDQKPPFNENIDRNSIAQPFLEPLPVNMNDNFVPNAKPSPQVRQSSTGFSQHTRSAVDRMHSPLVPQKQLDLPTMYQRNNDYLEVIRNLKLKHERNLSNNFANTSKNESISKPKIINVDVRKSQQGFRRPSGVPESTVPRQFNPRQPDYVVNNIGVSDNLRTMEDNDLLHERDYHDRNYINDDRPIPPMQPSPEAKRRVQVPIRQLSQKVLAQF